MNIDSSINSKSYQKLVNYHIGKQYIDEVDHIRYDNYVKAIYKCRKETIKLNIQV